jgi:hypothetical protein
VIRLLCLHLLRLQLRVRFPPEADDLDDLDALDDLGGEALGDLEADLGDLEADLGDLEAALGDLEADLGDLEADLGDLEADLLDDLDALGGEYLAEAAAFEPRSTIFIKSQFTYFKSFIHPNSKINVFKNEAFSCCSGVHFSGK